jgi:hypothetical protein
MIQALLYLGAFTTGLALGVPLVRWYFERSAEGVRVLTACEILATDGRGDSIHTRQLRGRVFAVEFPLLRSRGKCRKIGPRCVLL